MIAVSERQHGADKDEKREANRDPGHGPRIAPFMQEPANKDAKQDEHDHVNGPTSELVLTHANVAEVVKKELSIPQESCQHSHCPIDRETGTFGPGGEFNDFSERPVLAMQPKAINHRGQKCAGVGENINDIAAKNS